MPGAETKAVFQCNVRHPMLEAASLACWPACPTFGRRSGSYLQVLSSEVVDVKLIFPRFQPSYQLHRPGLQLAGMPAALLVCCEKGHSEVTL